MRKVGFPGGSDGKESSCNAEDTGSIPGSGRFPGEGRQPIPVFLPGESHGQRSLVGRSSRGHKESDVTERLTLYQKGKKQLKQQKDLCGVWRRCYD